jgi:hypothetical protein
MAPPFWWAIFLSTEFIAGNDDQFWLMHKCRSNTAAEFLIGKGRRQFQDA